MRATSILHVLCATTVLTIAAQEGDTTPDRESGRLLTLYAGDDLRSSFSLREGGDAAGIESGEIDLDEVLMIFDVLEEDMLTFGFVSDVRVNILDLGPLFVDPVPHATNMSPKFPISVFHTLFLESERFSYYGPGDELLRLPEADWVFETMPPEGLYTLEPIVGHTYVVRTKRMGVGEPEELGKFLVVDFQPGHSVTIRWATVDTQ